MPVDEENGFFACDLSACGVLRIAGTNGDARTFLHTMFTGDMTRLSGPWASVQGLFLNSEGQVIDACLVFQTGPDEFLVLTTPDNIDELVEWLSAHVEIADDAGRIFPSAVVEDHSADMAALVLYGAQSKQVGAELQRAANKKLVMLPFSIDYPVVGIPGTPSVLILTTMGNAAAIGAFLTEENPGLEVLDSEAYHKRVLKGHEELSALAGAAYKTPEELGLSQLLREEGHYVGARALGLE